MNICRVENNRIKLLLIFLIEFKQKVEPSVTEFNN